MKYIHELFLDNNGNTRYTKNFKFPDPTLDPFGFNQFNLMYSYEQYSYWTST